MLKSLIESIFTFYSKYITWCIIISSFLTAILAVIYIDLDSMYYAEYSELAYTGVNSTADFLGLSKLKASMLLFVVVCCVFLTVSSFFDFIKKAAVLFISSFFIRTWLVIFTAGPLILNLGFIKIFKGMTEAEKQAFVDSLKDNMIQYFEELPLEIQKIANPDIFKETTINYLNSLKNVIPAETVATPDIFSTVGYYLWDNKFSIIFGILNILVLAALNSKINTVNGNLNAYIKSDAELHANMNTTSNEIKDACLHNTIAIAASNKAITGTQESIDIIKDSILSLKFNDFNILNYNSSLDFTFINIIILLIKKILNQKKII